MSFGYLVVAATTLAIPFTHSIPLLMLSQAIGGVGRGLVFPILMRCTMAAVVPGERATAMGFFQATYALGMTMGPWIAGWLVAYLGLRGCIRDDRRPDGARGHHRLRPAAVTQRHPGIIPASKSGRASPIALPK